MTAKWTEEIENRFTELRLHQLSGSLTDTERTELTDIRALVEAAESKTITPALQKLEREQDALQGVLASLQTENNDLVQLLNQQAMLIADTKSWLREFEQRYSDIQSSFTQLTQHSLAT